MQRRVVDVLVPVALDQAYSYRVPDRMEVAPGDLVDVPLLSMVAFAATVPDAVDEVRAAVHYVTRRPGGDGAVREICDLIRAAQKAAK